MRNPLAAHLAGALDPVKVAKRAAMDPDPWQRDVLRSDHSRIALNIHRQGGKSTVAGVMAVHRAVYYPGSLVLLLSPSQRQSSELFKKALGVYRAIGRPVPSDAENALSLELENGSRIVSLPGTEQTTRGYSAVDLLIIDEAARVDDAIFASVSPMLAISQGRIVSMSTPYGRRGWWYGATQSGLWKTVTVRAPECPRITAEWLANERNQIGEFWFKQEYYCEFLDPSGMMFRSEDLDRMFSEYVDGPVSLFAPPGAVPIEAESEVVDEPDPPWVLGSGAPIPAHQQPWRRKPRVTADDIIGPQPTSNPARQIYQ